MNRVSSESGNVTLRRVLDPIASILVSLDDPVAAETVKAILQPARYEVIVASGSNQILNLIAGKSFDLLILALPPLRAGGSELLRSIRDAGFTMLILAMSPRGEEVETVEAFHLGADDYVVTPVGFLELMARVTALLRRIAHGVSTVDGPHNTIQFGEVVVNRALRGVTRSGRVVNLTPREFDLLQYLLEADGRIVSRATILRHVWGYGTGIASRTIDQHIARLRFKLEKDPLHPEHVLTVRKAGYRLRRVLSAVPVAQSVADCKADVLMSADMR
ncbi:MAG: response regulator transcription factor [Gemmatimonadaceae bacterium]